MSRDVRRIARAFAVGVKETIAECMNDPSYIDRHGLRGKTAADVMGEIRRRNATTKYRAGGFCASADFCDSNMPMLEAFEAETGKDFPDGPDDEALWNEAWDIAKRAGFDPEAI